MHPRYRVNIHARTGGPSPTWPPTRRVGRAKRRPTIQSWPVWHDTPCRGASCRPASPFPLDVAHSRPWLCVATGSHAPGCAWSQNGIEFASDTAEGGCATGPTLRRPDLRTRPRGILNYYTLSLQEKQARKPATCADSGKKVAYGGCLPLTPIRRDWRSGRFRVGSLTNPPEWAILTPIVSCPPPANDDLARDNRVWFSRE
jgi:hypothetical protein